ncbi:40S ribosomal protein S13-1 [Lachnellula willkommii]|uniref:40S ribosomal protein S13-1 n=1 Tax=Lachnellula willkommii TaxID=215461 RepID=A0A559MNF7_9HELO|nr:40S ribosomal protein S13-1 [Lachnellula willkommii]
MGRLHSNGKGISASAIPYSRTPPAWLKTTPEQVVDQICKLAKKGATPSQIGVVLRDSHGIAQVKVVTDSPNPQVQWYDTTDMKTILNIFGVKSNDGLNTKNFNTASAWSLTDGVNYIRPRTRNPRGSLHADQEGLNPSYPQHFASVYANLNTLKAVAVRKHLERNRKDKDSKFRLILIESRIHRLSRYYKTVGVLPPTWRYESATASTLVS